MKSDSSEQFLIRSLSITLHEDLFGLESQDFLATEFS